MIKELDQQVKAKATPKKLVYGDSDRDDPDMSETRDFYDRFSLESSGTSDTHDQIHSFGKSQKNPPKAKRCPTLEGRKAKLPINIKVYEGHKDPKDHLSIFSAIAEQEELLMPIWCKMFLQTLGGATQNWFDDLDPKSVDSFEELSQKFLEEFSQQKRYAKDPTEIHGIKRRLTFMHGHGHPKLANKLNDTIPKTMDEMFERVRDFIRGEVAAGSAEMVWYPQWDKGNACLVWSGGQEKARNRNDIGRNNKKIGAEEGGDVKIINMVNAGANRKRPYKRERFGLTKELTFLMIPQNNLTDKPVILEGIIEGHQVRRIHIDGGSSSKIRILRRSISPSRLAIVKCRSPYNVIMGRTGMRSLRAVGSTIHSMIKFSTNRGVVMMETSKEALWECRQLEKMLSSWKET
ncbi:hypothetical protein Tco_0764958 [Tanacetum coccineum]